MTTSAAARTRPAIRRLTLLRLGIFFVVLLACDVAAQLGRLWAVRLAPAGGADWFALGSAVAFAAILIAIYVGLVRGFERRSACEVRPGALRALIGVALGLALFSIVFALLYAMGIARWQGLSAHFDVLPMLAAAILAAVGEELAFRGGVFRILEDGFGTTAALVVSAAIFGLLHAFNPGATIASSAAIALEAGVLLGAAYVFSRNLWLPIGIHLGWNFTEGGVFGVSVSGFKASKGMFAVALSGPNLLTGGKFGPEASIVAVVVCVAAASVLVVLAIARGHWISARIRMVLD